MVLLIDTREPWPHPWAPYFGDGVTVERATLETGDLALAAFPVGAVVERKTAGDFLSVIGGNRERFERELKRSRHVDRFCVIVEAPLSRVIHEARGIHPAAIVGTVAAWTRRYCPILFADTPELAAALALRWLLQPVEEAQRIARAAK
jgi:ERCC4-type nuclease